VKNIPIGLNRNYKDELKNIFTQYAVPGKLLVVTKVVLVYNIEEIIELEEKLKKILKKKQRFLEVNNLDLQDYRVRELDKEIEQLEHKIHHIE
jgi:hypothetical protein